MKLYYSLLGGWQLPGHQDKGAIRCDIAGSPAELADWLNARGVTMTARPSPSEPEGGLSFEQIDAEPRFNNAAPPAGPCPVRESIRIDEDFDKLPLARQLDLAARAMENARDAL